MSWGDRPPGPVVLEPQDSPDHPLAPWFAHWRADRAAARGPATGPARTRAVATIVHNESVFLPLWLAYYGRFFAPEDIYVLDNETTDGSTAGSGFVRIPAERDRVDHTWMVRRLEELQHELVERYDVVLVTDVDEIVAPVPEAGDLGSYLDHFGEEWVNCLGYEILHSRDEPPVDLHRPVMDQRRWWYPNDGYNKAAVATVPMRWRTGFHGREDFQTRPDPDLRMVHLHRMDHDLCLDRHRVRSRKRWAGLDSEQAWAVHNQIVDEAEFDRWFYGDSSFEHIPIRLEEVHAPWRGAF